MKLLKNEKGLKTIFSKEIILSLLLLVLVPGCGETIVADDSQATDAGVKEVVAANNQFAFELYDKYKDNGQNVFFSPYSISAALAMTYEGAKGETKEEMKNVFHFPEIDVLRPNFAKIYNGINKGDKAYELKTGNALWAQKDYAFSEDYISTVRDYYGGEARNLDFKNAPRESTKIINDFIEEQTSGKIKNLITPDLSTLTRLVITNAIYFKGNWEWEFDKSDTTDMDFKMGPGSVVKTPMMFMDPEKTNFNYAASDKMQILELPYKGGEISMLILLPRQGRERNFETREDIIYDNTLEDIELSAEKLAEYKSLMKEAKLSAIYLPKFEFDTKYFMKETLEDLGMPTAFDDKKADFSGMTEEEQLFISQVIHQAYIKVDEKGTEAAAATAVVMMTMSAMAPTPTFKADHPFIFIIQEKATGNILFMGRVVDPSK